MDKEYEKLFELRNRVYAFLRKNLVNLESKINPFIEFWSLPSKNHYLYFTKSRALDIIYSNNKNLNFITSKFPSLDDKELNYEFSIDQQEIGFTIDLDILLNYIKEIIVLYNKENYNEIENKYAEYNRFLNKQKSNYNNLKIIIDNKLVIHNRKENLKDNLYKEFYLYNRDIEKILDTFSLYSYILLELFQLENSINNNLRKCAKILTLNNN